MCLQPLRAGVRVCNFPRNNLPWRNGMVLAWIVNGCLLAFVAAACINLPRRRRSAKRRTGELVISPLSGLAMGAMQLGLQAIVQPQAQPMKVEEKKGERGAGGREPTA